MSVLWTILLLALAAAVCVAAVIHFLANMLLRPPRMSDGKALYVLKRMSPADLGLPFTALSFDVPKTERSEPIKIAAWWIEPASPSEKTVVVIHGYGDAKVGSLAWAPTWRDLGFNCLLIDLRAHGESGGTITTGGVLERDDLDAILNRIQTDRPTQTKQIVLFGISLGGAVALACAARRADVAAVVCDSTFTDYAVAAAAHGQLIGTPLPTLLPWTIRWAEKLAKVRFEDARPVEAIAKCACPILLIHGDSDPFVPDEQVLLLGQALIALQNPLDDHWIVDDAGHVLSLAVDAVTYRERLRGFLERLSDQSSQQIS